MTDKEMIDEISESLMYCTHKDREVYPWDSSQRQMAKRVIELARLGEKYEQLLADMKERKTGKWVIRGGIHNMYTCYACSECGRGIEMYYDFGNIPTDADVINEFPYCHCGARMEVDE